MNELASIGTADILGPAFLAGLLVLISHVPLGRQVLQRGIIFIDLAVAQAAATGALIATMTVDMESDWLQQACAATAALSMVTVLHQLEKRWPEIQEPLIGASFVILACIAVLVTANDPHGGEHIHDLMAGQILWSSHQQLIWLGTATLISLSCMMLFKAPLLAFYIPFAIAITAAVQVVGVYLVFASLIFPALSWRNASGAGAILFAVLTGATGYALGLLASLLFDLPSGPSVVLSLAICSLLAGIIRNLAVAAGFSYNRQNP